MALRKIEVVSGQKFNYLKVVKEVDSIKSGKHKIRMVLCVCDCSNETIVRIQYLRSGHTKSCGCAVTRELLKHGKTHGLTGTRLHGIWAGMKARCYNKNRKSFKHYGAKGTIVCDDWMDFKPFYEWATNNCYEDYLTIERIDPYGNYEPSNCKWIPKSEQGKNKRSNSVKNHVGV